MKHTEKLDLILKALYNLRFDNKIHSLVDLCESQQIPLISSDEIEIIAKRLEQDGYIRCIRTRDDICATLTSHGIEYCEENSYAYKGHSIISNYYSLNITNSPNANIISSSTDVNINQSNQIEIKNKIKELRSAINNQDNIGNTEKQDILDCLKEVEANVEAGRKSKFAFKHLVELASNVAGVGSLLLDLGQLIT